jgi:ubiquitin-protein ligase
MSSGAFNQRREQDIKKIEQLAASSNGLIRIMGVDGNPMNQISIELGYKTAADNSYPGKVCTNTKVQIELTSRYPFQEPNAVFKTKVFHPNVYTSGKICFGTKWLPTEGLDLLVKRIVQIITFDQSILNENSPANGDALAWYRKAKKKDPNAFPTQSISFTEAGAKPTINWNDKSSGKDQSADAKIIINCPNCNGQLRVPSGKNGTIKCPTCNSPFEAST